MTMVVLGMQSDDKNRHKDRYAMMKVLLAWWAVKLVVS